MSKETGGPAFPFEYDYLNNDGSWSRNFEQGQTLRDHFAGLAMQGDWASQNESMGEFTNGVSEETLYDRAKVYYRMADAMLKARGE